MPLTKDKNASPDSHCVNNYFNGLSYIAFTANNCPFQEDCPAIEEDILSQKTATPLHLQAGRLHQIGPVKPS